MKTVRLQVRMEEDELEMLRAAADQARMTVSEFARFLLINGARGVLAKDEDELRHTLNSTGKALYGRTVGRSYLPGLGLGKMEDKSELSE